MPFQSVPSPNPAWTFVLSYTRSLAGELQGTGVSVTALCPGPVHTELGEAAGLDDDEVEGAIPEFAWEAADDVARAGVDALARGRQVVIPGTPSRAAAALAHFTPKELLVPILARIHPRARDRGTTT